MRVCQTCGKGFPIEDNRCNHCGAEIDIVGGVQILSNEDQGDGFKSEYFDDLSYLEANNFWFRARNDLISSWLQKYSSSMNTYLEIGCGTGFVLQRVSEDFPDSKVYGSEYFIEGIDKAQSRNPGVDFFKMDARNIPFSKAFDCIGMFDVLEHIEEDEQVLGQLRKALVDNGVVIFTVPQYAWLWSDADEYACHKRRYTGKELDQKVVNNGFEIIASSSYVTTLFPLLVASRVASAFITRGEYDPTAEFRIPNLLNSLFYKLLSTEVWFLSRGGKLPLGGSRILIAKKLPQDG